MSDTRLPGPLVELVAGEALGGQRAVIADGAEAFYADKDTPEHGVAVRGITTQAVSAAGTARVQVFGPLIEPSWNWTPGAIFVGNNGLLTQTPPTTGFVLQIATADGPTRIFIDPKPPIYLA